MTIDAQPPAEMRTSASRMEALATLPVFLKLNGKRAVLVGGSVPALWKCELLAASGARVDCFAEDFVEGFDALAAHPPAGSVTLQKRRWRADDLSGAAVAIGAITDAYEAAEFTAAARVAGVIVNVVDRPEFCDFQFGAIVNRSPLIVAISTDGAAPVFGQAIRSLIEGLLPVGMKRWAEAAKTWRGAGERLGGTIAERRRFWERFADLALAEPQRAPEQADFDRLVAAPEIAAGLVTFVEAPPVDPELLTLAAVRALRSADAVVYDCDAKAAVLDFARRESQRIPVTPTDDASAELVRLAIAGSRVVRLSSGAPSVRDAEVAALAAAGVTIAIAPPASA